MRPVDLHVYIGMSGINRSTESDLLSLYCYFKNESTIGAEPSPVVKPYVCDCLDIIICHVQTCSKLTIDSSRLLIEMPA